MIYGKGDRHAQQRRRRKNNRPIPKQLDEYLLIDGNYSNQPYKYCSHYHAYLTKNQVERHSCESKNCTHAKPLEWPESRGLVND